MDVNAWIKQIKSKEFFFAFFDVFFLVVSGIPVLFFFERQFFLSADWIKLVLLSGAISAPLVFLNTIALSSFEDNARLQEKDGLFFAMSMAAMSTTLFLNGPLLGVYWTKAPLTTYMIVVATLECGLLLAGVVYERWFKKPQGIKKKTQRKRKAAPKKS
jgi:hypothetical protein